MVRGNILIMEESNVLRVAIVSGTGMYGLSWEKGGAIDKDLLGLYSSRVEADKALARYTRGKEELAKQKAAFSRKKERIATLKEKGKI